MPLLRFDESSFEDKGVNYPVFRRGQRPDVVIIHEIPGIIPQVAEFGQRVADAGFTVVCRRCLVVPASHFLWPMSDSSFSGPVLVVSFTS